MQLDSAGLGLGARAAGAAVFAGIDDDARRERADDGDGLGDRGLAALERGRQPGDQLAVLPREVRVEPGDLVRVRQRRRLGLEPRLFLLKLAQPAPARRRIRPVADHVDQALDLPVEVGEPLALAPRLALLLGLQLAGARLVGRNGGLGRLGREELCADAGEHAALQLGYRDGAAVVAGAAVAVVAAGVAARLVGGHRPAAAGALDHPGEDALGARAPRQRLAAARVRRRLHGLPVLDRHDGQLGNLLALPFRLGIDAAHAAAAVRVAHHPHPVPNPLSLVQRVVQDAIGALPAADDRRGRPGTAVRRRNAAPVEVDRERLRALAGEVAAEDLAHDLGLALDDLELAGHDLAGFVEAAHGPVAVGAAARRPAGGDPAGQPATDLGLERVEEDGIDRALEADMQGGNLALLDGHQPDAEEGESLGDVRGVLLIAREPIQRLGEHGLEPPVGGVGEQRLEPRAPAARAAERGV